MDAVLEHINWVDFVAVVILLASGLFAYFRGFTHELLSIGSWALAIILALSFFPIATPYVTEYIDDLLIAQIIAGGAIFLITLIIAGLISSWLANKVLDSSISALDRSLGFLYGLIRGGVLISMAFLIMHQVVGEEGRPPMVVESRIEPYGTEGSRLLVRLANSMLPAQMHLDQPDSTFEQITEDARRTFQSQTIPIDRINDAIEAVTPEAVTPDTASEEPSYTEEQQDNLDALIEQETNP